MFWLIFLLANFLFFFYHFYWKRKNLPPGPLPLPFIGNLHSLYLCNKTVDVFLAWREKYGILSTYWIGGMPVVSINDYDTLIETIQKDGTTYEDRPEETEFIEAFMTGGGGIGASNGAVWYEQRRYVSRVLREFGLGRNLMQERILDEFAYAINCIRDDIKNGVQEISLIPYIDIVVGSIINQLVFGYSFQGDKASEFTFLKNTVTRQFKLLGHPTVMIMRCKFRLFGKLPYFKKFYREMITNRDALHDFCSKNVREHKARIGWDSDSAPTDFCEAYLKEIKRMEKSNSEHFFSEDQLISVLFDLLMDGQEPISINIAVGMIYLLLYPEVQKKLHEELDTVIGSGRLVTLEDKQHLHYTSAVVQELIRLVPLFLFGPLRRTTRDVQIKGYRIPKDTAIGSQIAVVLRDTKHLLDPENFMPERFLDSNGHFKNIDQVVTFGLGKRSCPGESLAKMEVYLFVANVLNQFKFSVISGKEPTLKRPAGGGGRPFPYVCKVEERIRK